MGDLIIFLIAAGFALLLWALIGHVIWLIVQALLKVLAGQRCKTCGQLYLTQHDCPLKTHNHPTTPGSDLAAARRLLSLARDKGWLLEVQQSAMKTALARVSEKLRQSRTTSPSAQSVSPSPTEPSELPPNTVDASANRPPQPSSTSPDLSSARFVVSAEPDDQPVMAKSMPPNGAAISPAGSTPTVSPITPEHPHPLDIQEPAALIKPSLTQQRQRFTADLLTKFMEQSNIRWIEIISASLIVVCSVGLVISLWNALSATSRFFPSLVFLAATLAVHGAGQYTLRQWKLRTTSRGILHIGLMLIPLSMLVGILLARRPGELPSFDVTTVGMIAIGIAVYASLTISACQALFARHWKTISAAHIAGTLLLIPIDCAAQFGSLESTWLAASLAPLWLLSSFAALVAGRRLSRFQTLRENKARQLTGWAVQVMFVSLVVLVFWHLQLRAAAIHVNAWWIAAGGVAVAWACFGWSASFPSQRPSKRSDSSQENSPVDGSPKPRTSNGGKRAAPVPDWFVLSGWVLSLLATSLVVVAVFQLPAKMQLASCLLLGAGSWWIAYGLACNRRISTLAGAVSVLLSATFFAVLMQDSQRAILRAMDWIQFPNVCGITCVGLIAFGIAIYVKRLILRNPKAQLGIAQISWSVLADQFAIAGGLLILVGTGLTTFASFTPDGQQWAPPILLLDSVLLIAGSLVSTALAHRRRDAAATLPAWRLPVQVAGQLMMTLAIVQLFQYHAWLETAMHGLRPDYAWAVGLAVIGLSWSSLAAVLRTVDYFKSDSKHWSANNYWLTLGSAAAALCSATAIWMRPDQWMLASQLGWFLPLTCAGILLGRREAVWREASVLTIALWTTTCSVAIGIHYEIWQHLGLACTSAAIVSITATALVASESLTFLLERSRGTSPLGATIGHAPLSNRPLLANLAQHSTRWATAIVLVCAWIGLVLPLTLLLIDQVWRSIDLPGEIRFSSFLHGQISPTGCAAITAAIYLLAGITLAAARFRSVNGFDIAAACSLVPLAISILCAVTFGGASVLPTFLWCLVAWLISLEAWWLIPSTMLKPALGWLKLLPDAPPSNSDRSHGGLQWIELARGATFGTLISVTAAYWIVTLVRHESQSPLEFGALSGILGPLLVATLAVWIRSVWTSNNTPALIMSGGLISVCIGGGTFLLSALPVPDAILLSICTAATTASLCSWSAIACTISRNTLMLQSKDTPSRSLRQRISKTTAGRRWRTADEAGWQLNQVATIVWIAVSLLAALLVVLFPGTRTAGWVLPGIAAFGSWMLIPGFLLAGSLHWWQYRRRRVTDESQSNFGILAIGLGLLAPLAAATVASWLNDTNVLPSRDAQFIPIRALMSGWLAALVTGLGVQIALTLRGRHVAQSARIAWLVLGSLVAGLGVVCVLFDPNFWWPCCELMLLALMTVISGTVAGGRIRGHFAAILASVALLPWVNPGVPFKVGIIPRPITGELFDYWHLLWGPIAIGLIAISTRILWRRVSGVLITPQNSNRDLPSANGSNASYDEANTSWVDYTVIYLSAAVNLVLGYVWIASQGPATGPIGAAGISIGLLAITSLGLAATRLWVSDSYRRGLPVYLSVIASVSLLSGLICSEMSMPRLESHLLWMTSLLTAMACLAGGLRELTLRGPAISSALGLAPSVTASDRLEHARRWMTAAHGLTSLLALVPTVLFVMLLEQRSLRMAATALPLLGIWTILPIANGRSAQQYRYVVVLLASLTLVLCSWADLPRAWAATLPADTWIYWQRSFAALIALALAYAGASRWRINSQTGSEDSDPKEHDGWGVALYRSSWIALGLGILTGGGILYGQRFGSWSASAELASMLSKLFSLAAWPGIVVRLLHFAARPNILDQNISVKIRKAAVYGAQAALCALCATSYFHFPNLFAGYLAPYWPIVVFGIAAVAGGLGHWLARRGENVLAEPTQISALLLPAIPLLGAGWLTPDTAPIRWDSWNVYALLLLAASGIYAAQAKLRSSITLQGLSVGLLLGSYWAFLHGNPGFRFLEHPQFWLLPPAIATLAFVQWNQFRLHPQTVIATRYIALLVAYLSSSAEVFFQAYDGDIWQPLLLLILALFGVAAGIGLQIRSFLYLGATFTFSALVGMVWHAQQAIGQVWPWWAFGIATGVSLIVMLGFFEKNRTALNETIHQMRQWES